jgi:hypothetical protein
MFKEIEDAFFFHQPRGELLTAVEFFLEIGDGNPLRLLRRLRRCIRRE